MESRKGFELKPDFNQGVNYIPYIRAYDYVHNHLSKTKEMQSKVVDMISEKLENLRKNDPR